jgi:hypothetical protein
MMRANAAAAALAGFLLVMNAAPAFAETEAQKQAEAEADAQEKAKRAEAAKEAAAKAPPPAIPGAESAGEAAAPTKNVAEMSPNDALFDAINRGDSAGARDAISRGAQLDAHNVLGQTPTDAAIEANRNDITFLLLSLRGTVSNGTRPRTVQAAQATTRAAAHRHGVAQVTRVSARGGVPATTYADPGRPNPSVGFNGF